MTISPVRNTHVNEVTPLIAVCIPLSPVTMNGMAAIHCTMRRNVQGETLHIMIIHVKGADRVKDSPVREVSNKIVLMTIISSMPFRTKKTEVTEATEATEVTKMSVVMINPLHPFKRKNVLERISAVIGNIPPSSASILVIVRVLVRAVLPRPNLGVQVLLTVVHGDNT